MAETSYDMAAVVADAGKNRSDDQEDSGDETTPTTTVSEPGQTRSPPPQARAQTLRLLAGLMGIAARREVCV